MRVVRSQRVLTPEGVRAASVQIADGRIAAVADFDARPAGAELLDFGDALVMPGVVDTHVHVNEPGRTEWEGFRSATDAAAAGGITAIVDMPLNSVPVTTTRKAFEQKREAARGQLRIDAGFWGGVVPGNLEELSPMVRAGVLGFKCFLIDSGIDEFGWVGERELRPAMDELARLGVPLLVHAEVAGPMPPAPPPGSDSRKYSTYLHSRPRASEDQAVALAARLCAETGARTHIVHHSSSDALPILRDSRRRGAKLTAETCPHYLHFAAEEIPDGRTEFKCAPPIRERENREALWAALGEGLLDLVASDHSPCTPQLKALEQGEFDRAWGGVSGLELALPVTWTEASARGHSILQLAKWMCEGPTRLAGFEGVKGKIAAGHDADLVIFADAETQVVRGEGIHHKHKITPYLGETLRGVVHATYLRGTRVAERGRLLVNDLGGLL